MIFNVANGISPKTQILLKIYIINMIFTFQQLMLYIGIFPDTIIFYYHLKLIIH